MGLRICLVTPFAWSQPHDVNEHVAGVAEELRKLGHVVTILASSNRARDLAAGRRALLDGLDTEVVALGPAVPISRRSRIGVPVGSRANLSLALALGHFDVVHGFEPALPSLSYLALRDAQALTVATFVSEDRLAYPPGRAQRERLLARLDALVATSRETAEAAALRFPGAHRGVSDGVQPELAGAELARLAEDETFRARRQREAREGAEPQSFAAVARDLDDLYRSLARRRRPARSTDPLSDREWIVCDLHMHTSWSHDCAVEPADLVMYAEAVGLGAIAVTDHNALGGALAAAALVHDRELVVIPGEEVKTDGQGEVIGLFLRAESPGGMRFGGT